MHVNRSVYYIAITLLTTLCFLFICTNWDDISLWLKPHKSKTVGVIRSFANNSDKPLGNCSWSAYKPEGLIDTTGKSILGLSHQTIEAFSENLAVYSSNDDGGDKMPLYGYINNKGKLQIGLLFESAGEFHNRRALVYRKGERRLEIIDESGRVIGKNRFIKQNSHYEEEMLPFRGWFKGNEDSPLCWGFADINGKVVIEPRFSTATNFRYGLAIVSINGELRDKKTNNFFSLSLRDTKFFGGSSGEPLLTGQHYGVLDKQGKFIIAPNYDGLRFLSKNCFFYKRDRKWGIISVDGREILPPILDSIPQSSSSSHINCSNDDEPIAVSKGEEFCFVNNSGQLVFNGNYKDAHSFSEGMAVVAEKQPLQSFEYFFIDKTGRRCFSQSFRKARDFHEGLAAVQCDEYWTFINKSGKTIVSPIFTEVQDFHEGIAVCSNGSGISLLSRDGSSILLKGISRCSDFSCGAAKTVSDKFWVCGMDLSKNKPFNREMTKEELRLIESK